MFTSSARQVIDMNKHTELIERFKSANRISIVVDSEIIEDGRELIDLLEQYGRALERLGSGEDIFKHQYPISDFDRYAMTELEARADFAKSTIEGE